MKFKNVIGIDVSKLTLDAFIWMGGYFQQFENTPKGYLSLVKWAKTHSCKPEETLLCFEHTGLYSLPLATFLSERNLAYSMISGLEIKRSSGMLRGKSDKIDAKAIAEYAYLRMDKLSRFELPSKKLLQIKNLLTLREKMVRQKGGYVASINEQKAFLNKKENKLLFGSQDRIIKLFDKQIKQIDQELQALIKQDKQLDKLYKLITSVKGIGPVLAANFLVVTNCFQGFETSRQFACYCGIAPFGKQSGSSLKKPQRVHPFANKRIKMLLFLAAESAIQFDPELKAYYHNRVEKGKSKMSTLNVVKNKIVARVFAVVKRETPFVIINKFAA